MTAELLEWDKQWQAEVWSHLESKWKEVRDYFPDGQTESQRNVIVNFTNKKLSEHGLAVSIHVNVARLNLARVSIPGDVLSFSKAVISGKHYFWDRTTNTPVCPATWPLNRNIPMAVLAPDLRNTDETHYGMDHFVAGFAWAWAQAEKMQRLKPCAAHEDMAVRFAKLATQARGDYRVFASANDVRTAAIQYVNDTELERETNGFTGFRKALTVAFVEEILKKQSGENPQASEIAKWLKVNVRWHDPRKCQPKQ